MQVRTRMIGDEEFESSSETGLSVKIDMRSNDSRKQQNPPELLLSALAACAAVDIVSILTKRKKHVDTLDVVTTGTRRTDYPRAFTDIHCEFIVTSPDVNDDELLKATKLSLENYCTVAASLKSKITYSAKVSVSPKSADH
jgi:putative redox protein